MPSSIKSKSIKQKPNRIQSTCIIYFAQKKDTCKLAFYAIWNKITTISIAIDKYNIDNVISNMPFTLHLPKQNEREGKYNKK